MKKLIIVSIAMVLLFVAIFSGCTDTDSSSNDREKFIGTWMRMTDPEWPFRNYSFLEDGTYLVIGDPESTGTWSVADGILTTTSAAFPGETADAYYTFSDNNQTLTLTDVTDSYAKVILIKISNNGEPVEEMSIDYFRIEPTLINEGEAAELEWVVVGADSVTIDHSIGTVSLMGKRVVTPTENTTYTLTASTAETTQTATATIIVSPLDDSTYFVGTWSYAGFTLTFLENGTYFIGGYPEIFGIWDAEEGILTSVYYGETTREYYVFSDDYMTLTLTNTTRPDMITILTKISN